MGGAGGDTFLPVYYTRTYLGVGLGQGLSQAPTQAVLFLGSQGGRGSEDGLVALTRLGPRPTVLPCKKWESASF